MNTKPTIADPITTAGSVPVEGDEELLRMLDGRVDAMLVDEAYRQQIAVDVFHSLVHGVRIRIAEDASPESAAAYIAELHGALMGHAEALGILPAKSEC